MLSIQDQTLIYTSLFKALCREFMFLFPH